eukprot:CAMPEP_0174270334 /NCGR_PEP_ID=MMETSP0439-20130205/44025_1 /TAXON_ID=0 /ORGANISM="Stereomyxa ramosa, Strain Chinc5" /LENGTH=49 /DNA_ID=CAMNT_0015359603 /DNA_START=721 /DNA_END=870 /DNA_ORIENTATION=+
MTEILGNTKIISDFSLKSGSERNKGTKEDVKTSNNDSNANDNLKCFSKN